MHDASSKAASPTQFFDLSAGSARRSSLHLSAAPSVAAWIACGLVAIAHLTGCGVTYNTIPLTANPGSVAFGTVQVGDAKAVTVAVKNQGLKAITLSGMQVADPAFQLSPAAMPATIPAGGSANVTVTFVPAAAKNYSSQVVIASAAGQTSIDLSGIGQQSTQNQPPPVSPALELSATTLQFGSVPIGGDAQQSLTLTSSGTAPLQISALNASGAGFSAQAPALPLTLQPGQTLSLPVKFGPTGSGATTGQLVIASDAAAAPSMTVSLLGSGASQPPPPPPTPTPALTLSTSAVDFGSVTQGSQASSSVTLTSSGTAPVVLQSVTVSGAGFSAGQFPLPVTLAPGQQIALPLTFTPSAAGNQQGQVTLADNATGSPSSISLTGNGVAPAPVPSLSAPPTVDFGDVTVGSEGSRTITLVSNGTAPVTVNSIVVAGATFSNAPVVLPQVLQPNQQMSVKLKFDPQAEGDALGTLTVGSDAASSPTVKIHGRGGVASTPSLSASASSLSFGQVLVGSQATKTVTVTSTGTAPATITAGSVTGASYAATYAGVPVGNLSAPITLQPGQQVVFSVTFGPTTPGTATGQLSLATDTGAPVNVALTGQGEQATSPALTVSAPSLNFGDVQVGANAVQQLTLTSSGTAPVTISSAAIAGQQFQVSSVAFPAGVNGWPATLNPGEQVTLSITFTPDAVASFSGDLALTSNASGGTANVPLSGNGQAVPAPKLTLSTASINFGQVQIGAKPTRSLTLTSSGNAPLDISSITVAGARFSVATPSLPVTLQPGQQMTVTVTYEPTTAGADAGTLTVTSSDSSGPGTVSLGGDGTPVPVPQLTASPAAVNFGSTPLNTPVTQPVTLTSTGTGPLTISAATVSGTAFSMSGATFPVTLNPNQAVTLQVQFDPSAAGAATGQLTISSDSSSGGTTNVALSGTGTVTTTPQLTVSPTSLAFGNVAVNSTATLPLTLTSSGTAPVTISAATVAGADFSVSGTTFPVTLSPNQTLKVNVQFAPNTAGQALGQWTITSNSSTGATTVVQLSGTGTVATTPQLLVSATSLSFGSVPVGSTGTQSLTLTSSGTAPVTVSSVALAGAEFSDSGATFPMTLNPTQAVTLTVQFDPTAAGAASGKITITSNSTTGSPAQVPLSGTGTAVPHEIDLSWDAPASSADPVAGYNVYRSTDGGASFTKVNASPDSQVTYADTTVQSGTTYMYQVKSVDASGVESAASNQWSGTVP